MRVFVIIVHFSQKKRNGEIPSRKRNLFLLETVAASASAVATRIAYVDFAERAVIACAIVLTFRYTATDARVHFLYVFIHHNKKPPFLVATVCVKC